ncbi:MAG: MFS transporter [Candidatus Saccharimonadales bacterium]
MKQALKSLRLRFQLFSFFDELILIYPLYTIMFADRGLNPGQITSLLVAFSLAIIAFELPTGSIADRHSRRNVMLVGESFKVLAFVTWLVFPTYFGYLAGIVLWALKIALVSGAREALIYDELSAIGQKSSYTKVLGDMQAVGTLGVIAAALGASVLAPHGYNVILITTALAAFVAALSLALLPSTPAVKATTNHLRHIADCFKKVVRTQRILYLQLLLALVIGAAAVEDYFSLFFREHHFSNSQISLWIGLSYVFITLGSLLASRLKPKVTVVAAAMAVWIAALLASTFVVRSVTPITIALVGFGMTIVYVISVSELQSAVKDGERATMVSIGNFGAELVAIGVFAIVYFNADRGYSYSLRLVAFSALIALVFLLAWRKLSTFNKSKVSA